MPRAARSSSLVVSLLIMVSLIVSSASSAPINAKHAATFELACDNDASYSIVVNGNGPFSPGHKIDGAGQVLIPVAFSIEGVDQEGNLVFRDVFAKHGTMHRITEDLITCTFTDIVTDGDRAITVSGTVMLFEVPRHET